MILSILLNDLNTSNPCIFFNTDCLWDLFTIKVPHCINVVYFFGKKGVQKKLGGVVYNDIAHWASLVVSDDEGGGTGFPYMYDIIYTSTTYKTFHLALFWRGLYIHVSQRRSLRIMLYTAAAYIELFTRDHRPDVVY